MKNSELEKSKVAAALAESQLFGMLGKESIAAIAGISHEIVVSPGTLIFKQGDLITDCYIVISGRVKIFRTGRSGDELEIQEIESRGSFGVVAFATEDRTTISAKAVDETHLIVIPKDPFVPIVNKYPEVSAAIRKELSRSLRKLGPLIDNQLENQLEATRLRWVDFLLIIGLSILCALTFNHSNPKGIPLIAKSYSDEAVSAIGLSEALAEQKAGGVLLIDARPSELYEQEHIAKAVNLPLSTFDFMYDLNLEQIRQAKEIIVYGKTISMLYDEEVAGKLIARGHKNVKVLKTGLQSWKKKGYPVEP